MEYKIQEKDFKLYDNYDKALVKEAEEYLYKNMFDPNFDFNSISILKKRYFKKDRYGNPLEDVKGLIARVSANIAYPDYFYTKMNKDEKRAKKVFFETAEKFYDMIEKQLFMPNSPTLMNAGRKMQQLSACFVLPTKERISSIPDGIAEAMKKFLYLKESGVIREGLDKDDTERIMKEYYKNNDSKRNITLTEQNIEVYDVKCPQCGSKIVFEEGCKTCHNCGWSQC